MDPFAVFYLVLRLLVEVTDKGEEGGSHIPILALFNIVMAMRNFAFIHTDADTMGLATYLSTTFQAAKLPDVTQMLADALVCHTTMLDVKIRITSWKHVHKQPADLNASLVKRLVNPEGRQWVGLCRNIRLRSKVELGTPQADSDCPRGMTVADVAAVTEAVNRMLASDGASLPTTCAVERAAGVPATRPIKELTFSWAAAHVTSAASDMVMRALRHKYVGGNWENAPPATAAAAYGGTAASGPGGRKAGASSAGARPPASQASSASRSKRTSPDDPSNRHVRSVRRVPNSKLNAKLERSHDTAVGFIIDDDTRATAIRPHYVVGQLATFPVWRHGGVYVVAQVPFLLEESWRKSEQWVSSCRKILVSPSAKASGGMYEVTFTPKSMEEDVDELEPAADCDTPPSQEPLLRPGGLGGTAAVAAAAAAAGGAVPPRPASGDMAPGAPDAPVAPVTPERLGEAGGLAGAGTLPSGFAGAAMPSSAAGEVGAAGAAGAAVAAGATGVGPAQTERSVVGSSETGAAAAPVFFPLSPAMHGLLLEALQSSNEDLGLAANQTVSWTVLSRSPKPDFHLQCTFRTDLELDVDSDWAGSFKSYSYIVAAFPARRKHSRVAVLSSHRTHVA
eukprot:TRINITY_DN5220_c0_g1_i2.p1 TRINITY_DN5220_c0_g1~~TRINITY_DN5220_c0_g1_i2.p1  ORF type:complete len:634 (-),score=139.19 TRINITY_DN5220_c0_g1_i2:146-2011(-)